LGIIQEEIFEFDGAGNLFGEAVAAEGAAAFIMFGEGFFDTLIDEAV
jgi:hypothetical protein